MPESADSQSELRTMLLIAYGLFVFALFNGLTAVAGVVLAYLKRDEARGTVWESHYRNLIHVFWIAFFVGIVAFAVLLQAAGGLLFSLFWTNGNPPPYLIGWLIALVPVFYFGGVAFVIWYAYRTLRGLIHAIEAKPY
jgi:uncharacterized membrane protein